jgi:hypothetical protein
MAYDAVPPLLSNLNRARRRVPRTGVTEVADPGGRDKSG